MKLPWIKDKSSRVNERADMAVARVLEAVADQVARDLADEDASWKKLTNATSTDDLSNDELKSLRDACVRLWRQDPSLAMTAKLLQSGTFGRGITTPRAADSRVQKIVDKFWDDTDNQLHIFSRDAQVHCNLQLFLKGEQFFTLHTAMTDSLVKIGEISQDEITQVITHPDDAKRPVMYVRTFRPKMYDFQRNTWTSSTQSVTWYYLDYRYSPDVLGEALPDDGVQSLINGAGEALQQDVYLYHFKTNTIGLRGVPEAARSYDWVKAQHRALSDLATFTKASAMFAWRMKIQTKSQAAVNNAAAMFREPVPGTGSVHVSNQGVDLQAVDAPSGGQNMADTGRQMHLQAIRGYGFGEHWYANADTGNLATASAMELPAIWAIDDRQEHFWSLYHALTMYQIGRAKVFGDVVSLPSRVDTHVDIDFPPSQPANVQEKATAITTLAPLIDPQEAAYQAYVTLGSNDVEELMERQFPAEEKLDGEQSTSDVEEPEEMPEETQEPEPAIPEPVTEASGAKDPFSASNLSG